jgi:succinoglycan biosynthesis transport protein ExoP
MLQMAIEQPFSQFAEAFRTMKFKLSNELPKKKGIVLGMASLFPEEGKSTIAKNFASSLALQGMKTLLIDGDIRNPQLTMSLVGLAKAGLIDVVQGTHTIEDASYEEDGSGLTFLPSGKTQQRNDLFSSEKTHNLLDSLRQKYDVVVIDFPPVGALADALSAHPVIDGYFLVVHWGKTPRGIVKEFIINHPAIANKTLGVVLNKVEVHKLNRYGNYLSPQNYGKYAQRYFPTAERLKK